MRGLMGSLQIFPLPDVVELLAPWFVFGPRWPRRVAAVLALLFQAVLISSGNLAFLNWLTLVVGLSVFDDALLDRVLNGDGSGEKTNG